MHVGRWDELEPFVDAVYDRFGQVDVLFNNAGMSPVYDKLTDVSEKLFDSVVNLNFKGPFRLAALIGERMHAAGERLDHQRQLVRIDQAEAAEVIPYAGAKAALNAMSVGPRRAPRPARPGEHADAGHLPDRRRQGLGPRAPSRPTASATALQRVGQPPEIIGAALFLASDASSYTSGTIIRVDGGMF